MFKKLSDKKVRDSASFAKAKNKAAEYAQHPARLITLIEQAAKKADSRKSPLSDVRAFLMTSFRMVKAYAAGEYTNVPWQSLILIIASIVYFVMPADFIPDFILGLGLIDDAALLGWTLRTVKSSIDDFRKWEAVKKREPGKDEKQKQ